MYPVAGSISKRLRKQLRPTHPAWHPPRICPTPTRTAGEGYAVGRPAANPARVRRRAA